MNIYIPNYKVVLNVVDFLLFVNFDLTFDLPSTVPVKTITTRWQCSHPADLCQAMPCDAVVPSAAFECNLSKGGGLPEARRILEEGQ